jgi:cyclophilin family peptidyl-prolyl cis-trans isomerase
MKSMSELITLVHFAALVISARAWSPPLLGAANSNTGRRRGVVLQLGRNDVGSSHPENVSRRSWFQNSLALASSIVVVTTTTAPQLASAAEAPAAEVTDKIFLEIKGLPGGAADNNGATTTKRIVIGLFGKQAPRSVDNLKKLVSNGLPAACKPKEERMMQREQLEANKVYNSCIEGQDKGVTYDYGQIWRVIRGERLDFGSVAGRFVAREYPTWEEEASSNDLKHDRPGIVSVRRGSDSGFGFAVFPGGGDTNDLDDNHIVVGQVLEGLDVMEEINNIPVVTSSKVNYMGLTGGPNNKSAPSRSCRYGGDMYCNENKPLIKLTLYKTGVL